MLLSFFFNDTGTPEIYTLSLHDALPISGDAAGDRPRRPTDTVARRCRADRSSARSGRDSEPVGVGAARARARPRGQDRKSTRLNSSHVEISYAVFCLKKKNKGTGRDRRS